MFLLAAVWLVIVFQTRSAILNDTDAGRHNNNASADFGNSSTKTPASTDLQSLQSPTTSQQNEKEATSAKEGVRGEQEISSTSPSLPTAFDSVLQRAKQKRDFCVEQQGINIDQFEGFDTRRQIVFGKQNLTLATLPPFGIIDAIESFRSDHNNNNKDWQCELPPETECAETQLTVIVMAYNPDRLGTTFPQIRKMLSRDSFQNLVKECILVWNGERRIDESQEGRSLLEFASIPDNHLRVVYPLEMGLPNDLMNRYHPNVLKVKTRALLYYDDDGPFYSYHAIQGGFELWKRHARAQIGAMSRQINYSPRQIEERHAANQPFNDRLFVSHCDNMRDSVQYNFFYFANYDANMVLPSGSLLHANYLCFLWHPVLADIRQFVLDHPVHPDDIVVSTIVSQLAGLAPRVYSRRLNPPDAAVVRRRRLEGEDNNSHEDEENIEAKPKGAGIGGICWDCGQGMTEKKQIWADLRSQAINSLIRYFGSINSGSIGWCEGTPYYNANKDGKCEPIMARQGWLPWMKADGTPKENCP
jgi:hypothetical protein